MPRPRADQVDSLWTSQVVPEKKNETKEEKRRRQKNKTGEKKKKAGPQVLGVAEAPARLGHGPVLLEEQRLALKTSEGSPNPAGDSE